MRFETRARETMSAIVKVRSKVESFVKSEGRRPRILIAKMGHDGHDREGERNVEAIFDDRRGHQAVVLAADEGEQDRIDDFRMGRAQPVRQILVSLELAIAQQLR